MKFLDRFLPKTHVPPDPDLDHAKEEWRKMQRRLELLRITAATLQHGETDE